MKKLLFTLLMALPVLFLASCHDDDDLPDVSLNIAYSGGTIVDNELYVVAGDTLVIDSLWVTPKDATKNAAVLAVSYRLQGWPIENVSFIPFRCVVPTPSLEPGSYQLGIYASIIQVDKTPASAYAQRTINIVENASDIPATGTYTETVRPDIDKK